MSEPKKFVAYLRATWKQGAEVSPTVTEQRQRIIDRVAVHPHGEVVGEFTEVWRGDRKVSDPLADALRVCAEKKAVLLICDLPHRDDEHLKAILRNHPDFPEWWTQLVSIGAPGTAMERGRWDGDASPATFIVVEEASDEPGTITLDGLWERIERDCAQYLAHVCKTRHLLIRGAFTRRDDAYFAVPRPDRIPRDTPPTYHDFVNGWLTDNGFAAHRGNSIFTTADVVMSEKFGVEKGAGGALYAIFPCDGFAFTWSRYYKDFGGIFTLQAGDNPDIHPDMPHILWKADFANWDFAGALTSGHEVMISGAPYYAIKWKNISGEEEPEAKLSFSVKANAADGDILLDKKVRPRGGYQRQVLGKLGIKVVRREFPQPFEDQDDAVKAVKPKMS